MESGDAYFMGKIGNICRLRRLEKIWQVKILKVIFLDIPMLCVQAPGFSHNGPAPVGHLTIFEVEPSYS